MIARNLYQGYGYSQPSQSEVGEYLSWDEAEDQERDLDHEIEKPSEEQLIWKWDQPSSPSTEEAYMDYLEADEMDDYFP